MHVTDALERGATTGVDDHIELERGIFVISLDFELIWGTLDLFGPEGFRRACETEHAVVIDRLLNLFAEFEVRATWCTLGHLFLEHCTEVNGHKHPEIVRPKHAWATGDWFEHDPCGTEGDAPIFLGRSLVEKIRACPVPQEIGSHSFSHVIFGDAGCSRETAESEIKECVRLASEMGIELRSFAFPRNKVGHLDVLREYGFTSYRGADLNWYEQESVPGAVKRVMHLWDVLTARRPPVVLPARVAADFWDIPGSMIYFPMHGFRRYIPLSLRIKRAVKGLDTAARRRRIYHLWFHPTNMSDEMEAMFAGLRTILAHAAALRARGELAIMPMQTIAQSATAGTI